MHAHASVPGVHMPVPASVPVSATAVDPPSPPVAGSPPQAEGGTQSSETKAAFESRASIVTYAVGHVTSIILESLGSWSPYRRPR